MIGQEYIEFSKKNIIEYFKLILEKKYNKELVLKLLDTYIKVRYYNYYETKSRNAETNINYYMKQIVMEDKENEELKQIFKQMMEKKGLKVTKEVLEKLDNIINQERINVNFGNARFIRNVVEKTIINHATNTKNIKDKKVLRTITLKDIT